jgi:predicted ATPase
MPAKGKRPSKSSFTAPFLKRVSLLPEKVARNEFPFNALPFLQSDDFALEFPTPITFFVGENGSGKSTLLEAVAALCGFHAGGGSHHHQLYANDDRWHSRLAESLRPAWLPKVNIGFFFRSESFFNLAGYIDEAAMPGTYGERKMHAQSHGESFLAVFTHGFDGASRSILLMDEPEAALSPSRQLAFLAILRDLEVTGNVQAIVATHAPILLSYPGATLYSFDGPQIEPTTLDATEHYRVTKAFLANPDRYLADIFGG